MFLAITALVLALVRAIIVLARKEDIVELILPVAIGCLAIYHMV